VAALEDQTGLNEIFTRLGTSEGQPPLSERIRPSMRDELRAVLEENGLDDSQFASMETWAAALMIAQAETDELNSKYGIDREVMKAASGKPIVELEGAAGQLALFDALPESEQRDLLEAIVSDAASLNRESANLAKAWRTGDMQVIARETEKGLLADPELRQALFTGRNARWTARIAKAIDAGQEPFVAVGAAHMAGPEGLPKMLAAQGFSLVRLQ
jgi:uncharacterized protein YbaP (TraB family)